MRAFTEMWDRLGQERDGVTDAKARRFRYGVQVNSLGLTEAQPENNVQRIVLEMLGVTPVEAGPGPPSVQLPAWNEALGPAPPVGPAVVVAQASRCWRSRPTCWSTTTSSTARTSSRPR